MERTRPTQRPGNRGEGCAGRRDVVDDEESGCGPERDDIGTVPAFAGAPTGLGGIPVPSKTARVRHTHRSCHRPRELCRGVVAARSEVRVGGRGRGDEINRGQRTRERNERRNKCLECVIAPVVLGGENGRPHRSGVCTEHPGDIDVGYEQWFAGARLLDTGRT